MSMTMPDGLGRTDFTEDERASFYRLIAARRDIRKFRPDPVPEDVVQRMLWAAHQAGSVGFMQPWNFIVIRDVPLRESVKQLYIEANKAAAACYDGERRDLYDSLKLEGIVESPLNICVTCDRSRGGPHVLGRHSMPETDLYSTCTSVQNLWLAARVEGVGVGWVSIVDNDKLADILNIPRGVVPVAYLCVGYPVEFPPIPELELLGWRERLFLEDLVFTDRWPERTSG
jgi:5,6-dimethylbenzimidazole synthase